MENPNFLMDDLGGPPLLLETATLKMRKGKGIPNRQVTQSESPKSGAKTGLQQSVLRTENVGPRKPS